MNGIESGSYPIGLELVFNFLEFVYYSKGLRQILKVWYSLGMPAKKILNNNGDFQRSPLLDVVKKLDSILSNRKIPYTVIGGLGVVRNGAVRTTVDVDILISEERWHELSVSELLSADFEVHGDWARDRALQIDVDVVFSGDSWEMIVPYPLPEEVREWDKKLEGWFIGLFPLLELKTAVYLKKREEDGPEIAAKDLADVVALIQNNREKVNEARITSKIHPKVFPELLRIYRSITK